MHIKKLKIKSSKNPVYKKLLKECYKYAEKSVHPSTHNAALLVDRNKIILRGINNLPLKVKQLKSRFQGDNKHVYPNHAERDLIYNAARKGIRTDKRTMVMPWLPCINCANAIISSGIKKLIVHKQMVERTKECWKKELKSALKLLKEAKIGIIAYDGLVGTTALMHKKRWNA
ncbi:hypothetical protein KJ780_05335 [Candidatus Micrarchaeota archaeon]|nr:hypothetical protein [Candidatus Micrarchaeota archaeon]